MLERKAKKARKQETYRAWRRNNSNLGWSPSNERSIRDWHGVEAKYNSNALPTFQMKVSERGEVHYIEATQ